MLSSKTYNSSVQNAKSFTSLASSKSSTFAARELYNKPETKKNKFLPKYVTPCTEVRQRVLSTKALRNKTFRNKLQEAELIIAKLKQENRMLMTIHQRQDTALSKYECASADLPNLLNAHVEELSNWEEKHRQLQNAAKNLEDKIKNHENVICHLNQEIRYYGQLNKSKTLDTKENLVEKIDALQEAIQTAAKEEKSTIEYLQNEIKHTKEKINERRSKAYETAKTVKQMQLEINGMNKVDALKLQKDTLSEKTNNEDMDGIMPAATIKKPAARSESIPTRIPIRKIRSINTAFNKNKNLLNRVASESEPESKPKFIRKTAKERGDGVFVKPRPVLRRKLNLQQGGGDAPNNSKPNQLRTGKERGDGDGPTKSKNMQYGNRIRALKQLNKSNVEENASKKVIFCETGDTDGNDSMVETAESQTANMSVTSDLTADTGNLADIDNADDHDDNDLQDDMPKSLLETDDDSNIDCMDKIISNLRVPLPEKYANQHNPYMANYSELEHSN